MKIYINTLTTEKLAVINEKEAKLGTPTASMTKLIPTISGEVFPPGEWKHVADTFAIDSKTYPYIKEAHIVAQEKVSDFFDGTGDFEGRGMTAFSTGLKKAATLYSSEVPAVAKYVDDCVELRPVWGK